jgi:ABC-type multidrug transport system permease subunit
MYNAYMITKPQMHPWFGWIYWIDPLAYTVDALLLQKQLLELKYMESLFYSSQETGNGSLV